MSVLDKFLDIMKMNDDDEYDEFYDDEYENEYEEEKPKRSYFSRFRKNSEDDEYEEAPAGRTRKSSGTTSKVTPMRRSASRKEGGIGVCVMKPNSVEDSREITETLLSGRTVILNLEGLDLEVAQRIIDFTSGATYAISGNLQKVSNYIFLVTPTNVDISGDLQDLLGGSTFDVSSIHNRY